MPKWLLFGLAVVVVPSLALVIFIVTKQEGAPVERAGVEARQEVSPPLPAPPAQVDVRPVSDESRTPSPADTPGYLVIGLSSRARGHAEAESERRKLEGHQTHVRSSDDWSGLAPGWHIVVHGTFDNRAAAERAARALKSRGVNAYAKHSGQRKAGREASPPDREVAGAAEETQPLAAPDEEAVVERYNAEEQEALREVRKLWDQHYTPCGDSYVTVNSRNVLRQLKGVTFVPRGVTFVMRAPAAGSAAGNEVEWSGTVQATWEVWRQAVRKGAGWAWDEWRESPQSRSFEVRKVNSEWKVLNVLEGRKKVDCSEVSS